MSNRSVSSRSKELSPAPEQVDAYVEHHGNLFLVRPVSSAAFDWLRENVAEDAQHFGNALVVEPRYITDLVRGMVDAGLVLQ